MKAFEDQNPSSYQYEWKRVKSDGQQREEKRKRNGLKLAIIIGIVVLLVAGLTVGMIFVFRDSEVVRPVPNLKDMVNMDRVMNSLRDLENISLSYNNSRAVETGYNASIEYIESQLAGKDYNVSRQYFDVMMKKLKSTPTLSLTQPYAFNFAYGTQFEFFPEDVASSGSQSFPNVPVSAVENGGCSQENFAEFPAGNIAMYAISTKCNFRTAYQLAVGAQAKAVVLFVYPAAAGQALMAAQVESYLDQKRSQQADGIPIFFFRTFLPLDIWTFLLEKQPVTMSFTFDLDVYNTKTMNLFAESNWGQSDSIVFYGSHLDSVLAGPGINDDGSGSMSNLELAKILDENQKNGAKYINKVRFGWWGAEELGLLGSLHYIQTASTEDLDKISFYANFDMIGSPNFIRVVGKGGDTWPAIQRNSSNIISEILQRQFRENKIPIVTGTAGGAGSDDYSFFSAGIPVGSLFTGAGGIKSPEQRSFFGGVANAPTDPCYHQPCDTVDNIDRPVYTQMILAAADTLHHFASQPDLRMIMKSGNEEGIPAFQAAGSVASIPAIFVILAFLLF